MSGKDRGRRRHNTTMGRTKDALDAVSPGQTRKASVHAYLTRQTHADVHRASLELGITMGGMVALLVEGAKVHGNLEAYARVLLARAPSRVPFLDKRRNRHARSPARDAVSI